MNDSFFVMNGLQNELAHKHLKKGTLFISYEQVIRHIAFVEKGCLRTCHINDIWKEFMYPAWGIPLNFTCVALLYGWIVN